MCWSVSVDVYVSFWGFITFIFAYWYEVARLDAYALSSSITNVSLETRLHSFSVPVVVIIGHLQSLLHGYPSPFLKTDGFRWWIYFFPSEGMEIFSDDEICGHVH